MSVSSKTFKVIVVGDAGIGKTAFVRRFRDGVFDYKYQATMGVEVSPITLCTDAGDYKLVIWDCADNPEVAGGNPHYTDADACVLMFDVTGKTTYEKIPTFYNTIKKACGDIPIVLCGNKVDCKDRKVKPQDITFHRLKNLQYYDVSAKSCYNFQKPFLHILKKLTKNDNLTLNSEEKQTEEKL